MKSAQHQRAALIRAEKMRQAKPEETPKAKRITTRRLRALKRSAKLGGVARAQKLSKERRIEIATMGAAATAMKRQQFGKENGAEK